MFKSNTLSKTEVLYTPDSPLAQPRKLVVELAHDVYRCRELVWILFLRDLKAQYRQSYLGYIWLFLPPLLTTAVWMFLNGQNVVAVGDTGMPYPVFVIIGTVIWQTFVKLLQNPINAFNAGKPVFMKLKVPPEAFIIAGLAKVSFEFVVYALVIIPVFIFFGVAPTWVAILLPLVMLSLFALGTSLGLLLVPAGSLYSDIQQAIPVFMGFLMYMAPVVYPPPESGVAGQIINYNPMTPILMGSRDLLTNGSLHYIPAVTAILFSSILVLTASALVLRIVMPHLVARMGM